MSGAGDHVFDVVGVTWGINVRVVPLGCPVLAVVKGNGDATSFLFGSVINTLYSLNSGAITFIFIYIQYVQNACRKSGLAVINVTNSSNVDMGLRSIEYICHSFLYYLPRTQRWALEDLINLINILANLPR